MRIRLAALCFLVASCSAPTKPCEGVTCSAGKVCNPLNGLCIAGDGGTANGGGTGGGGTAGGTGGGTVDAGIACTPACTGLQKCDTSTGQCVSCLSNADCACPAPLCLEGLCRGIPASDGGVVAPIPGESCATAAPLALPGCTLPRSATFRVDLSARADDDHGVCSASAGGGRDLVYLLTLDATYDVDVSAAPVAGSMAEPLVYVRKAPCTGGQELACMDGQGGTASVHLKSRPAGQYALFIDTYDAASGGAVDVTLTLSAATLPGNESCLSAEEIATDGGRVRVNLALATDDEPTSCNTGGNDSRDAVWHFTLDATSDVVASAIAVGNPDAGISPIVEIRGASCGAADVRGCRASSNFGPASLRARSLSAGSYYLVVESWDGGAAGEVDVSVSALQPSPPLQYDTCAAPRDIVFLDGGTFTELDIDTSTASDDETGSCNENTGGPEYIYRLRLTSARHVTVTAGASPGSSADPVLYLRRGACGADDGGVEIGCSDDPTDSTATELLSSGANVLTAGDYFIFVESYGGSTGLTHLTVSATP